MLILIIETAVNYCSSFISNSISESWLAKMKNLATAFNLCIFMPRHKKWRGIMLYPPNF